MMGRPQGWDWILLYLLVMLTNITLTSTDAQAMKEGGRTSTFLVGFAIHTKADVLLGLKGRDAKADSTYFVVVDAPDIDLTNTVKGDKTIKKDKGGKDGEDDVNNNKDKAEIRVTPTGGLTTTEAGGTATFTMALTPFPSRMSPSA